MRQARSDPSDCAYGLLHLPSHLAACAQWEDLYALIDDLEFRSEKIALTGSVHGLCEDIRLAFEAALDDNDMPRVVKNGFLHANYVEGRFGKQDIPSTKENRRVQQARVKDEVR